MKKHLLLLIICGFSLAALAQKTSNIGFGFQSAALSFGGVNVDFDRLNTLNDKFSLITRFNVGYISPFQGQQSLYLDAQRGYKFNLSKKLYAEQLFGIGYMYSKYESAYWFENQFHNLVYTGKEASNYSLIPSISTGIGYKVGKNEALNNSIWIRPKLYWQLSNNLLSQPSLAIQVGYSMGISK